MLMPGNRLLGAGSGKEHFCRVLLLPSASGAQPGAPCSMSALSRRYRISKAWTEQPCISVHSTASTDDTQLQLFSGTALLSGLESMPVCLTASLCKVLSIRECGCGCSEEAR